MTRQKAPLVPFYRDDDEQFRAGIVDDASMAIWEEIAVAEIPHIVPGGINWPMIVRSLIAEVRKLRSPDVASRGATVPRHVRRQRQRGPLSKPGKTQ